MEATEFDEEALFSAIARSGVRALLVPCIDDMILTKRWSLRPKDVDDIAMLEKLKQGGGSTS